jgi:hypothetical protein
MLPRSRESRERSAPARVCVPTFRRFRHKAFQCALNEAQDVLAEIDDVDFIPLEPGRGFNLFTGSWHRKLLYRDFTRTLMHVNPGMRQVRLAQDYDLFVAVCQSFWDLLYLNAIEGWRDRVKTSVCWIDEMWAAVIPHYRYWLAALNQFDYVFVAGKLTVEPLGQAIGKKCHWLPGAVDTLRFSPYPAAPRRVIDVYSIGRRSEAVHRVLLDAARAGEMFYVHDTFPAANMETFDQPQHRDLFANMVKRSRYFMVAPAKVNALDDTGGQVEVGHRYFEGAAGGAVMLGESPQCDAFQELFPWQDAVLELRSDGSDTREVLNELESSPERVTALGRRNAAESLLRHDWVHRWREIYDIAGMTRSVAMTAREHRLTEMADSVLGASAHASAV